MASLTARKQASQSRSRASVDAILEASAQVMEENGYKAFSTNAVAQRAGVSIGTLYQYFPNKESLLATVQQRHLDEIAGIVKHACSFTQEQNLSTAIKTLIGAVIASHTVRPRLHLTLRQQAPKLDAKGDERSLYEFLYSALAALFEAHRSQITITDVQLASFMVVHIAEGAVHAALEHRPETHRSGVLAHELVQVILSYLLTERKSIANPAAR